MVAEARVGPAAKGRRGIRVPPFGNNSAHRAVGLEAAVVDRGQMQIVASLGGASY